MWSGGETSIKTSLLLGLFRQGPKKFDKRRDMAIIALARMFVLFVNSTSRHSREAGIQSGKAMMGPPLIEPFINSVPSIGRCPANAGLARPAVPFVIDGKIFLKPTTSVIQTSWIPAYAGMTNEATSSCLAWEQPLSWSIGLYFGRSV